MSIPTPDATMAAPAISVVVVCDYGDDEPGLAEVLAALLAQELDEPFEVVVVEEAERLARLDAIAERFPSVRFVASDARGSYALKNHGVEVALGRCVALLDGDCRPRPGWLASLLSALYAHPEAVAVSGRTRYQGRTAAERAFAVLSRGYVDLGRAGETHHVSNNNTAFVRSAYLAAPLPTGLGPFAAGAHALALRPHGRFRFEPRAVVTHAFGGLAMERDVRRNAGWAAIALRRAEPSHHNAWLGRIGHAAIPLLMTGSAVRGLARIARLRRDFGLRWSDVPLAGALAIGMTRYEAEGMLLALRGRQVTDTAYR